MADQTLARYVNELSVLTLLRVHGPASRAELARNLGVTPATATRLVAQLMQRGLIHEVKGTARDNTVREPGRPSVAVALNPSGAYFLGIEIGVGTVRTSLLDLAASVVSSSIDRVSPNIGPEQAADLVTEKWAALEADPRIKGRIRSVGVTVPGLVTTDGFVIHLPILGWKEVAFADLVSGNISLPCIVENNANAAAFGASYTEPALPSVCTIFLKLGTGCGGAAIINGRLLRGGSGTAGELGHIRLTEHGHRCSCGQHGCLESWVNLGALARGFRGHDDLSSAEFTALPVEVVQEAHDGDPRAREALSSIGHHLAMGIVTLVNIFNPTTIMLGGVMRPVLETILPDVRMQVAADIVPGTAVPELRLSALGEFECSVGVACLAHHHSFDLSRVDLAEPNRALAASG